MNDDLKNKISKVIDLSSDNSFRQTCTSSIATDIFNRNNKSGDRRNLTFFNVSPRRLGLRL
jgi:hypothetical protein